MNWRASRRKAAEERVAAQMALADLPLAAFLSETVVPYEDDEVTRLIVDEHDAAAFAPVAAMCVGDFRDWLLSDAAHPELLTGSCARHHSRDGGGCFEDHAAAGSDYGGRQNPRRHALPEYARTCGPTFHAAAAESSDRRSGGHCGQYYRRTDLWQRRCRDRNQPGLRQPRERGEA